MAPHTIFRILAGLALAAGGVVLAGGCGATINVVQCDDGEEFCGDTCVDLDTDPKHCGECFSRCVDGCSDGVCEGGGRGGSGPGTGGGDGQGGGDECGALTECSGTCVDTGRDEGNCGGCGVVCSAGNACRDGICVFDECAPLETCNGLCTNTDADPFNCGACNVVCPAGLCVIGECATGCTGNLVDCGTGTCVDLSTDEQHCGGCFFGCGPNQQCENFSCFGETCGLACGLCTIAELPSSTSIFTQGNTSGAGDGFTSGCSGGSAPEIGHRYVAPVSGTYFVDTFGSSFDTVLSVLDGCGEIVCSDDASGTDSQVVVDLFAGQEVFFVVDGFGEGSEGFFNLSLFAENIPGCPPGLTLCGDQCVDLFFDNQHCGGCFDPCGDEEACIEASCQCIGQECVECDDDLCGSCSSVSFLPSLVPLARSGSTAGEDSGIESACGASPSPESLYRFVAPFDASFRFDTFGSSFDTLLAIRDPNGCFELACNDDFQGLDSQVELFLAAGQEVLIVVDGFSGGFGNYQLHVEADIPLCAPVLDGDLPIVVEDTTAGQPDTFQTSCIGGNAPDRTYHFFAPFAGVFVFDMEGSQYDTTLEILNGTCGGPSLDCNDDFESTASHLELFLEQDQLVTIVVDGFQGDFGDFVLRIE
jgi:hypothetical protein